MEVNIRPATAADAQGVVDVINSVIQEGGLTALYPVFSVEQEEAFIQGLGPRSAGGGRCRRGARQRRSARASQLSPRG